jgi:LPXTG-site transpeptidase (sortase) family protein
MTLAVVAGSASLTLVLRGPAPPPAYPATVVSPAPGSAPLAPPSGGSPQSTATATPAGVSVTVRLIIPAGGIDISVIPGDGVTIPMDLAMHYPGTAWPGQGSNSVFYAHGQAGMFLGLYKLTLGDEVEAVQADGSILEYTVVAIERVAYNDRDVLNPTSFDQITLLTCTSYDPYTDRLIVLATLV